MPPVVNLAGQRFGRLLVLERAENRGKGAAWVALCDCGRRPVVRSSDLRTGNTKSCGCVRIERISRLNRAAVVDYFGAHSRVRALRGRADSHACVDCGEPAQDWSYDHADPDERIGTQATGRGLAYSLDPHHYQPRCKPCHGAFDAPSRKAV